MNILRKTKIQTRANSFISHSHVSLWHKKAEKMDKSILFENIWLYDDAVELKVVVSDGEVVFQNYVYVACEQITELINQLNIFKKPDSWRIM